MILILSTGEDLSTSHVVDWLNYLNLNFDRINNEDLVGVEIKINNLNTEIRLQNKKKYLFNNYSSYWYRRGNFSIPNQIIDDSAYLDFMKSINKFNFDERRTVQEFIHDNLKNKKNTINSFTDNDLNKLNFLNAAKEIGLKIPNTIITTYKQDVLEFAELNKKIISKSIHEGFAFAINDTNFYLHSILIEHKDIKDFPDKFYVTKFQAYIEKSFELRVFYLKKKFYASAIFSQNDEQTKIDFRNYNKEKPNRVLPYILPTTIKTKIITLMNKLNLNSGSLDIIVDKNGEYIFLEVNPIGQFTQVSHPCNYFIEKQIAIKLNDNE